jgi:ribosomal-protein-serine acetyltransferase
MEPNRKSCPELIETPRILIKPLMVEVAIPYSKAVEESYGELKKWIPWARPAEPPSLEEITKRASEAYEKFQKSEAFTFTITDKSSGEIVGGLNLFNCDWLVPHFEIGYWIRTSHYGKGYGYEGALALAKLAFEYMGARRVQLRCDPKNIKSCAIPERLGFDIEGTLRNNFFGPDNRLCDTRIYARTSGDGLPALDVKWAPPQ